MYTACSGSKNSCMQESRVEKFWGSPFSGGVPPLEHESWLGANPRIPPLLLREWGAGGVGMQSFLVR